MDEIDLIVGGLRYSGWKSVRVTRSIESLSGSFALDVSDRWGDEELWPIAEEDACRVEVGRRTVIDGYVDKRDLSASADSRTLSYTGRDRAAALIDCSALLAKWTYNNVRVEEFVSSIAAPFGVDVSVQPGLVLARVPKVVVSPGDTAYEAIRRATSDLGVLLVSDGAGGIVITRAGSTRAAPLVEGTNIITASVSYDGSERFRRYVVSTQSAGTDEASGNATRVKAEATDEGVRRPDRVLLIRPERGYDAAGALRRADWEARIRAARAETVTIGVQGWKQPDGSLWPVNAIVPVRARRLIGVDGDMLISQVEYSISSEGGQTTQLRLVRPDAFTPEPAGLSTGVGVVKSSGAAWKELEKGAL
jgi:prophage tail gpP-like protein